MTANAAAAAQAANALSALKSLGAKEYATSLAEMATLTEGGFDVLDDSLRRTGFANEWPAFILDVAVPEPANLTDKETVDKKNAYMLIVNKCQGHQVAHTMEPPGVPLGDAKAAYGSSSVRFSPPVHQRRTGRSDQKLLQRDHGQLQHQ